MDIYKPSNLKKVLLEIKAKPLKSLSQNFLIDKNIINNIISEATISPGDIVLEIGPGLGALTEALLGKKAIVYAVEKDKAFSKYLQEKHENLTLINDDILKADLEKFLPKNNRGKIKVVANLPYNITSKIILKLLEKQNRNFFQSFTLMMQKEMAHRMVAIPGTKDYGSLTIYTNFYAHKKICFNISSSCFYPKPNVDSSIVKFDLLDINTDIDNSDFHEFVHKFFQKRRKKISTILKNQINKDLLQNFFKNNNLNENVRPENLSIQEFLSLYYYLKNTNK